MNTTDSKDGARIPPDRIWVSFQHFRSRSILVGEPVLERRSESDVEYVRAPLAAVEGDALAAIDHWATMYRKVAADNTVLLNRLAESVEGSDLISRQEAVRIARDHDKRHDSGYRCYEGEVIAKKIAALPAYRPNIVTAARMVSQAITDAGFNNSPPPAKSWEEGKNDIPAVASSPLPAEPAQPQSHGVQVIAAERQRQFDVEGWTLEHDDEHVDESLAQAAACYAWPRMRRLFVKQAWPWQPHEWKPEIYGVPGAADKEKREARIHVLAKAGALIAAEIDRLERIK